MICTNLVATAFAKSFASHQDIHKLWITASARLGGRLPNSLLMMSVQRLGRLDMLLRSLEEEYKPPSSGANELELIAGDLISMLSELWIGSAYEIFRLSLEREIAGENPEFSEIAHHLKLIRIPLEKHEIASRKFPKEGLELQRFPPNGNESDVYVYKHDDKMRSHIMPAGISANGSMMWQVIDMKNDSHFWIERRNISDRIINILTS